MKNNTIWNYEAVREVWHDPKLGRYLTYGLKAWRKTEVGWDQIEFIHDITTECCFAKQLAALFNRHQLSPLHFRDAVEDMLP